MLQLTFFLLISADMEPISITKTRIPTFTPAFLLPIIPVSNLFFRRCSMAMLSVTRLDCPL